MSTCEKEMQHISEISNNLKIYNDIIPEITYLNVRNDLIDYFGCEFAIIYAKLCRYMIQCAHLEKFNGWFCYPISTMAQDMGFHIRTIQKYLDMFCEYGVLYRKKLKSDNKFRYYIPIFHIQKNTDEELYLISFSYSGNIHFKNFKIKGRCTKVDRFSLKSTVFTPEQLFGDAGDSCLESPIDARAYSNNILLLYYNRIKFFKNKKLNKSNLPNLEEENDSEKYVSKRRSIPNQKIKNSNTTSTPKKRKGFVPSERERQFSKMLLEKIKSNFPKAISENNIDQKIISGSQTIRKLVQKHGFEFKYIKQVLLWALEDSFWKMQFRSVSGLLTVSKRNGNTKFENMAMSYQQSNTTQKQCSDQEIEDLIRKVFKPTYFETELNNVHWFRNELGRINRSLPTRNRFYWHTADKFISVVKWAFDVDGALIPQRDLKTWIDLIIRYLEFLENRLQSDDITTLHAGMFSNDSVLFRHFIDDLSDQWDTQILEY